MPSPTRAPSAASRKTRIERTSTWVEKHGVKPALPHDWKEKEVTLQQLVDLGMLTAEEAAHEAGADLAPADAGGDDVAAAAPAPDLSATVLLYSQFPQAENPLTEDWRKLGERAVKTALTRPKPPTLFALSPSVERGVVGQQMVKRPRPWSTHDQFLFEVQLLVYRAAFDFCVKLPLTIDSVSDERFDAANAVLDKIGVAQLTKEEVLAKAFPAFELSGDALTWFSRGVLPEMLRQAADVLSLLTLPYEDVYPSTWFGGDYVKSRFLELKDEEAGEEEGEEEGDDPPRQLAIVLAKALIGGVISAASSLEIEGLEGLKDWEVGEEGTTKPVLATADHIAKVADGDVTISIEGVEEELSVSVAAKLIHEMTLPKLVSWVLTRLRSLCTKRSRGGAHFRTEEQEARARVAAAARARGTARRAAGGGVISQLRAELAEVKEAALLMAKLLLAARKNGTEVANALTDAKARAVHPKVCPPPMPDEHSARIRQITDALVSPESMEKANGIVDKYSSAKA